MTVGKMPCLALSHTELISIRLLSLKNWAVGRILGAKGFCGEIGVLR